MTPDRAKAPTPESPRTDRSAATPARRRRFAAALAAFGLWVAFLAVLASRSDPPAPGPGEGPPASAAREAAGPGGLDPDR